MGAARSRTRCLLAAVVLVAGSTAGEALAWNLADRPLGQWTLYNRAAEGAALGLPVAAGDLNGDGLADIVITPMNADSGPGRARSRAGEAIIVLSPGTIEGERDLAAIDPAALPADVTLVYGADPLDFLGSHVAVADIDGDGFADALIGAQHGDGPDESRASAGEVVILWGSETIGGEVIDLADLPRPDVTVIHGAAAGERFGTWIGAGDFDGDGHADVIVGADQGNGPDGLRPHAGTTWVIYGGTELRDLRTVDLAEPPLPVTRIHGIDPEDHSGCTVRGVDLDGDGAAEILIGAGLNRLSSSIDGAGNAGAHGFAGGDGPENDRVNAGEAYIVYGERDSRPAMIDLADPPASTVIVHGIDPGDAWGEEINGGDFNGDGFGDIVIGALTADGPRNSRNNSGETALLFGVPSLRGSVIDLADPPANVRFFHGPVAGAISGDTAFLIDLDGDGMDELVIGSPLANPGGRTRAGEVSILFGTDAPLPACIDLADPPAGLRHIVVEGGSAGDILAYSADHADVDGDGVPDLVFNGMGAAGFDDLLPLAGEAYVLSGTSLAQSTAPPSPTPTHVPTATLTPTSSQTPTPTPSATARPSDTPTPPPSPTPTEPQTATPPATFTATSPATPTSTEPPRSSRGCALADEHDSSSSHLALAAAAVLLLRRRRPENAPRATL